MAETNLEDNESEISLLDNPEVETQVKDKPYKLVWRVLVFAVLFTCLIFSYYSLFSSAVYVGMNKRYIGVFNSSNYIGVKNCDIVVVNPYSKITDIKEGDIVCYSSNIEKGSAKVVSIKQNSLTLEKADGTTSKYEFRLIIGKQVKTIHVLGFFLSFLQSYLGVVVLSIIIIGYASYITFIRINYENTSHGKVLYNKYVIDRSEKKAQRKLLVVLKKYVNPETVISSILDSTYTENLYQLRKFNMNIRGGLEDKYRFVLSCVHSAYLSKSPRKEAERKRIVSVIELMCESGSFDMDMEYMLIDLCLSESIEGFDTQNFSVSAINFINNQSSARDLLCFGSVLYILTRQLKYINDNFLADVVKAFSDKCVKINKETSQNEGKLLMGILKGIQSHVLVGS